MNEWKTVGDAVGETWDKKDPIQGVYTTKQTNVGPNESNMYTIKTDKGNVGVWGSTVIDSKFEQVPVGSEVKIKSLGMATGKSGKEYADFEFQWREVPFETIDDRLGGTVKMGTINTTGKTFGEVDDEVLRRTKDSSEVPFETIDEANGEANDDIFGAN